MVGLSDIPCVEKIVDRISDAMVDPLFRGFNYMFYYEDHVILLESKIQQLKSETDEMSREVGQEINNGKTIIERVEKWQEEVEGIQKSAEEFLEKYKNRSSWRCIQCMPIPKPISRFRLGREAVHTARRVTELSNSARDLLKDDVAYLPPVPNVPTPLTVFGDFQSRKDAYQKLWEALVTDGGPPVLGIYGMPGVGKTRMAEQIWKEAEEKKIFDKFARAVVGSEEVDVIKLRNQIAGHLSCKFDPQANEERRTSQLKDSIMKGETKGEKILIILDDVWREISLDSIGIPLGDGSTFKGLKILITSREETVCKHNRCNISVKITDLTVEEAWELFRNTVVNTEYNFPDESLAKKVCNKCAGLPLLIRAVGKALQYKSQISWEDALDQLEKGQVRRIPKLDQHVYACVELSINRLPDVDAKLCLFLCCMYPEDAEIYIRKLIQVATDTQLVPQGETRVRNMVDILRSASLLLDCEKDHKIKMHDLIREVARFMAVEDTKYAKYAVSIVSRGSQLPDNVGTRKFLHLQPEKNDFRFPDNLVCPDLHNLWMQSNRDIIPEFSSGFFGKFANLKFLLIEDIEMRFSLQALCNLKALILDECNLEETDVNFFPEKLETVCFWDCYLPVPLDLTNLKHLKKLEIQRWTQDSRDSLEELRCQHTNIFSNLSDYHIHVGDHGRYLLESSDSIKRSIELYGDGLKFEGLHSLIERAERVRLTCCSNINVGSIYNSNREAFADLRNLYMYRCDTVEYVARIRRGEIQHHRSFSKLTILEISSCSGMKYVFSKSVAKCLGQLRELTIGGCLRMEAIVMNEGASSDGDDDIINFSNLKSLEIWFLPRLKSFYMEEKDISAVEARPVFDVMIQLPNLVDFQLCYCGQIDLEVIEFGRDDSTCQLRKLRADCNNGIQLPDKWFSRLYNNLESLKLRRYNWWHQLKFNCFKRLKMLTIEVSGCSFLFSFSAFESLNQLQELEIRHCPLLKKIVEDGSSGEPRTVTLFHLKSVLLKNLAKLRSCFHGANYEFHMPALEKVCVENCGISTLFSFSAFESLNQLQELVIWDCPLLEEIVEDVRSGEPRTVTLFHLKSVTLRNLPKLKSCFHGANYEFHMPALEEVTIMKCGISTLFTCSVFRTLQQLKDLEVQDCILLVDIVEDAKGDETSDTNHNIITLPRFQVVRLLDLPNLKSFSRNSTYAFNMPVLQRIFANRCPQIENFTCLKTTTPLIDVYINGCEMKTSDPNNCVRAARGKTKSSNSAGESSRQR